MLVLKEMYFLKINNYEGTVSLKFILSNLDKDVDLNINSIKIDLNDATNPINYYKVNGNQLITGEYFELIFKIIKKKFVSLMNESHDIGMYKWESINNTVTKL